MNDLESLSRLIIEGTVDKSQHLADPIERYAYQLQMHWFLNAENLTGCLEKGYSRLIEEIIP